MELKNNFRNIFDNSLDSPLLIKHNIFKDNRGLFYELFNSLKFSKFNSKDVCFVQDNISISKKGVIRGLHFQISPFEQGKYISVLNGSIYDVFLDVRVNSSSFGKFFFYTLNSNDNESLWIPEGFAHGFQALSDNTKIHYKTTCLYNFEFERSINPLDTNLSIKWPLKDYFISEKDTKAPNFHNHKLQL